MLSKYSRWQFSLLCFTYFIYLVNADCGPRDSGAEIVEVLAWSGGSWAGFFSHDYFKAPNYLGHDVDKKPWNCPVDCRFTADKSRAANVDAVIFEAQPITSYYDAYKWSPPNFPQKYTGQIWLNHGYETQYYFHIYGDRGYLDYIDANFTYYLHSQVPITFTCLWGGGNFSDFLKPHPPKTKDKCVVFMTTNCQSGGAVHRSAYAKELMNYMDVHSYGKCLHNKDFPKEMQFPIYSDHGASMRNKIHIFKDYKFVLVFENNNVTDYVTEKMPNVLQAGSVPVYMGSPNVHPYWTPGENSIVKVSDFKGPQDLAEHLTKACENDEEYEKYFEWKKKGVSKHFQQRFDDCAFYGAECRLCQYILAERQKHGKGQQESVYQRRIGRHTYQTPFLGKDGRMEVKAHEALDLGKTFTLSTWIKTKEQLSGDLINRGGVYVLSLVPVEKNDLQARVRLCVLDKECFTSSLVVNKLNWQHVLVIYEYEDGYSGSVTFWVNGVEDKLKEAPLHLITKSDYPHDASLVFGGNSDPKFVGHLDDIAIWNIPIDSKRARAAIYDVYGGHEEGLAAYWSFNDGENKRTKDSVHQLEVEEIGESIRWDESLTKPLITVNPFL